MSIVRFASVCDECGKRGEEYKAFPACRECLRDICPSCQVAGTLEQDVDRNDCLCKVCGGDRG
jgi:ribosomal protein S14